ncbi:putative transcriptional regulator, MerR family [Alkaliphilus metalliredigens QYMF]|uniref:Putative transcriptional regulator, MerR family n=1 Tax=Alkaliphilus metalliredigens (strain QYMF) TaxID=293826 RepID=A6TVT1_ALKMQ|nr:MerR family transcriptional regulator [Alkaliphilus metalliredigens]ABR50299.1 putative transcriptional regulator, MerR family [Alkaliphilus metalliredigens QYMF]
MKIGAFSAKHNITIDTVRHYIDLGLLLPHKKGGQYEFTSKDSNDLQGVLELKGLKFTLGEIQKVFSYKRITGMRTIQDQLRYKKILEEKTEELVAEQKHLAKTVMYLQQRAEEINIVSLQQRKQLGFPLLFIQHLCCPLCKNSLDLNNGIIEKNMLMEGQFQCHCGYCAGVEKGIYIELNEEDKKKIVKIKGAPTIESYVEGTSPGFINFMYKAIKTATQMINSEVLTNKVILELGTGSGFFLKQFISHMDESNYYIITDHDQERMTKIKEYLEAESLSTHFVFICTDLARLPLKEGVVDIVVDYWGSTVYHFTSPDFLIDEISHKVKIGGKLVGCYVYVKPYEKFLLQLPEISRKFYKEETIQNLLQNSDFKQLETKQLGFVDTEEKYEPFVNGNKIYEFVYYGKKDQ